MVNLQVLSLSMQTTSLCKHDLASRDESQEQALISCIALYDETKKYPGFLVLEAISHALCARRDWDIRGGQNTSSRLVVLLDLSQGVDETRDETDDDGGDTGESNGGIEEDETGDSNGELIQGADHGVSCRGGDTDTPGGSI